jgi:hypothetical protein
MHIVTIHIQSIHISISVNNLFYHYPHIYKQYTITTIHEGYDHTVHVTRNELFHYLISLIQTAVHKIVIQPSVRARIEILPHDTTGDKISIVHRILEYAHLE